MDSNFRYDPLYRVIDEVDHLQKLEGSYRDLYRRLKEIDNLGIIPRVFEMAKYPKYEHSIGTVYQVQNLLDLASKDVILEKYRLPLKLASIFLHTGHLPFTYSTERSLLLAANLGDREVENDIEKYIRGRLAQVFEALDISEEEKLAKEEELFSMRKCESLYKYFSADQLVRRWKSLCGKVDDLSDEDLKIIIQDLVDEDNHGYRYLDLANKADYVQRDALYFGTVRIDISPKHLYGEMTEYTPRFSISEERLIEANLDYLEDRFYKANKVIAYSRLYEKIVASLMLSTNFKPKWLEDYDDASFERLITFNQDKKNAPASLPEAWIKRARELLDPAKGGYDFRHVFTLRNVPIDKDVIDVEYEIIDKQQSKRGLLKYPFEDGILISVESHSKTQHPFRNDTHETHEIRVFQNESNRSFVELLKVVKNLSCYLSFNHVATIREALAKQFSWTESVRFENDIVAANTQVLKAIATAIRVIARDEKNFVSDFFKGLRDLKSYNSIWRPLENEMWLLTEGQLIGKKGKLYDRNRVEYMGLAQGLVNLPVELLQFKKPQSFVCKIRDKLIDMMESDDMNHKNGNVFEAICLLDLLASQEGQFQFFVNGAIVRDPQKQKGKKDLNEYDIIELRLNEKEAECWIHACSIVDDYIKKDREKITKIARHIHDYEFSGLGIKTHHAVPNNKVEGNWTPKYENAGTNY